MSAYNDTEALRARLERAGVVLSHAEVNTLRRAQLTLHRVAELECGDDNGHASFCLVRDETDDKPYMEVHPYTGKMRRYRVPDRERGALKRVASVCNGRLHFFHQTDPRGCALYVSTEPLTDSNYSSRGVAIYA